MPNRFSCAMANLNRETGWIAAMLGALAAGLVVVAILGVSNAGFGRMAAMLGGVLLAAASALAGGFFGFLFGIPHSKQGPETVIASANGGRQYVENTNLEQISDWLTKIIIGLTLVQYQKISDFLAGAGKSFGPVLISGGNGAVAQALAIALILYFFLTGFLFFYLWTRIYMEALLRRQHALLESEIETILHVQQQQQNDSDADALELVESYLDEKSDPKAEKFKNIQDKLRAASLMTRSLIFRNARKVRRNNWKPGGNAELVQRTIPVFEGLIKAAPDKYHRNYGQLGYALVRQAEPDWVRAKQVFEKAIALRGPEKDAGSGYYEYHLALAEIHLDPDFAAKKPSSDEARNRIAALLESGAEVIDLAGEPAIAAWAGLNHYPIEPAAS